MMVSLCCSRRNQPLCCMCPAAAGEDLASHPWFQNVQQTAMQQQIVTDPPPAADDANAADGGAAAAAAAGEDSAAGGAAAGNAASLPADIRRTLLRAGIPIVGMPINSLKTLSEARGLLLPGGAGAAAAAAGAAAAAAQGIAPDLARRRLLDKAVKQWLTTFAGEALPGWMTRPKVSKLGGGVFKAHNEVLFVEGFRNRNCNECV